MRARRGHGRGHRCPRTGREDDEGDGRAQNRAKRVIRTAEAHLGGVGVRSLAEPRARKTQLLSATPPLLPLSPCMLLRSAIKIRPTLSSLRPFPSRTLPLFPRRVQQHLSSFFAAYSVMSSRATSRAMPECWGHRGVCRKPSPCKICLSDASSYLDIL